MENTNTNTATANVISAAPAGIISPDQGLSLMNALIARGDIPAANLAQTYQDLVAVHTAAFTPAAPVAEKKRRKRRTGLTLSPNLGWPKGVSREDYAKFKANPPADFTEGMNPQAYKRYIDLKNGVTPPAPVAEPTKQEQAPTPAPVEAPKAEAVVKAAPKVKGPSPAAAAINTTSQESATAGRKAAGSKAK